MSNGTFELLSMEDVPRCQVLLSIVNRWMEEGRVFNARDLRDEAQKIQPSIRYEFTANYLRDHFTLGCMADYDREVRPVEVEGFSDVQIYHYFPVSTPNAPPPPTGR